MIVINSTKRILTATLFATATMLAGSTALAQSTATVQAQGSVNIDDTSPQPAQIEPDENAATTEPGIRVDEQIAQDQVQSDATTVSSCQEEIDRLAEAATAASSKLEGMRKDMEAAAVSQPLLVSMADGSFVYLGDEGELSEPLGSWFTAQDMVQKNAETREQASAFLADQNEADCLELVRSLSE